MTSCTVRLIAAAALLLASLGLGGAAFGQAAEAKAAARGEALVGRLGCASCHGALGAGGTRKADDLAQAVLGEMRDGGAALYDFMGDAAKGHPDLNGNFRTNAPAISTVSKAEAADILAAAQSQYIKGRAQRGRDEGPGAAAAAGLPCKVTDGLYILNNTDKASKTSTDAYEVACEGAVGRVVLKTVANGQTRYEVQDCISTSAPMADGKPNNLRCALPANQTSLAGFGAYLAEAGVTCDLQQARPFGATAEAAWFEAACAGDRGFVVGVPLAAGKEVTARSCLAFEAGAATECRLTSREAMLASATAPLLARIDSPCEVKARRYVAASRGDDYYEVACASGLGFMIAADFRGGFKSKIDCANAEGVAGGCTLIDTTAAQTADNARYAALATAAGYDCAVSAYRVLGATAQDETVEMACANRPDGAVAQFPKTGAARVFNCASAETTGYRCVLTKEDAAYRGLTAAVKKARPASTCQVSASRFLGVTPDGGYVEVACADKDPGYVLEYAKATGMATDALYCSQLSAQRGVTCSLPTNLRK